MMWSSRFKTHSEIQQVENRNNSTNSNFAFKIPGELIVHGNFSSVSLFHGGVDSPSLNVFDPLNNNSVRITKYLRLKSKRITRQYFDHIYERILLTSELSHPNVCRIISWYIADGCLYSITSHIPTTLRQAIQSDRFAIERIRRITEQILHGTLYLQSKGLCPLNPWYTTSIELRSNDLVRLCSPTISNTKLNGIHVSYHHLWRHAPESLMRMVAHDPNWYTDESKEDVWSIGCIVIEMMIHQILFHPLNDDPSLQLVSIVQLVGGLKESMLESFLQPVKRFFKRINCDPDQERLPCLLNQVFSQFKQNSNETEDTNSFQELYDLLQQMLRFDLNQRISLSSCVEHSFFKSTACGAYTQKCNLFDNDLKKKTSISSDDLIRLCIKLNRKQSRWLLTLKENCLLKLLSHVENFSEFNSNLLLLSHSLKFELQNLIDFFTG